MDAVESFVVRVRIKHGKFRGIVGYVWIDDFVKAPPMIEVFATGTGKNYLVRYNYIKAEAVIEDG